MYVQFIKRMIDFIVSLVCMVIATPVFLLLMIAIKLDSPGPAVFTQERMGKDGKAFKIYKFRTMKADAPREVATDELENPDQWVTRLGKFLRKSSLDEIPQLLNIVKGEMAIVGPRPALMTQTNLNKLRVENGVDVLLPGLTGWAQINGRDLLNDEEKTAYDIEYLQQVSFWFDVKCIYRTIAKVAKEEGVVEGKIDK